jgi:branched-chain amino acid transport system substrate-binding protein
MLSFRQTFITAAITCLVAAAAGCGSAASDSSNQPSHQTKKAAVLPPGQRAAGTAIKVGYINVQGGPTISSPAFTEGAELAVSYANGYLNGIAGHPIQLIKCYTDGTTASTTACANQLVSDNVPLVIQGSDTNTSADPILAGAGIPYVTPNGNGPADLDTPGVFSVTTQIGTAFAGLAKYAKERDWKKVAVLTLNTPSLSQTVQQIAGPVYAKAGVSYQATYVDPGTPDQTAQVSAAMSGHPDALLFIGDTNTCTSFMKAVGTLGVTTPIFLVGSCALESVLASVPVTSLENAYVLSTVDLSDSGADSQTFSTLVQQHDPSGDAQSIQLRLGYLPVVTLARILKGFTGDPTSENLIKAIRSAKDVPIPFGRGATITCDGTAIPKLPSLCSPEIFLLKVHGIDNYSFVSGFNVAPLFAS